MDARRWRLMNRVVFWVTVGAFGYFIVRWQVGPGASAPRFVLALLFSSLMTVHIFAAILALEWIIAVGLSYRGPRTGAGIWDRVRSNPPPLPLGPARWSSSPAFPFVVVALTVIPWIARETGYVTFGWNTAHSSTNTSIRWTDRPADAGTRPNDRHVTPWCNISCSPRDSAICDGFERGLDCRKDAPTSAAAWLKVDGTISFGDQPFCYSPLYKMASMSVDSHLTVELRSGDYVAFSSASAELDHELSVTGIISCLEFRRTFGSQVGQQIAEHLNKKLRYL